MSDNISSPKSIAEDWYDEEMIVDWVRKGCSVVRPVPPDVRSREFGLWLCTEVRLAMAKGIELERNRGRQQNRQLVAENERRSTEIASLKLRLGDVLMGGSDPT